MGVQIEVIEEVETPELPLEYLEREICQLVSNIAAATCRWLLLLAEFDRREGWAVWGARSCADWLSWRCGIGRVAARDHLRVAHRLEELKLVRAGFAAGELSYSKVRAITRVATPETEATLVELARHATANHMEQIARAYRGLKRRMAKDGKGGEAKDDVFLHWYWDDEGYLVIAGRFPPEEGAIFIEALNAARSALAGDADKDDSAADDSAESRAWSPDHSDPRDSAESRTASVEHTDPESRMSSAGATEHPAEATGPDDSAESRPTAADALLSMAETMLRYGPQARDGGDRYQAVVTVDAKVLAGDGPGRCEIDNGPAISPELARQITCDSSVIMTILGEGGEPLNIGRTSRTIPRAIRRALRIRDGRCRFPGCSQRRFVDGHHIQHWSQGGETSLENLVLLCRAHHRKVHEEKFTVRYDGGTKFSFARPDGTPMPEAPAAVPVLRGDIVRANQELGLTIGPETGSSLWAGEQLDLAMVIDGLFALEDRSLN